MSRCGYSLRCSCYIGDIANNVYAILWVLFTLFRSHFGHCLQCLCNVVGIDYNVHVTFWELFTVLCNVVSIFYNVHVTFWAWPTMFMQYCSYCLQCPRHYCGHCLNGHHILQIYMICLLIAIGLSPGGV